MNQTQHVLIYGGSGGLGCKVVDTFKAAGWTVTSADYRVNQSADNNILLQRDVDLQTAGKYVEAEVKSVLVDNKLDAIVNVAGGWAGGNLASDDLYSNVSLMISQSVNSSVVAAKLAALHLKAGGLLLIFGADACSQGTPGMIAYGIAKAGVHHLVKSAAAPGSGLPQDAKVVALLPVTLDTAANRAAMPDADTSSWTPLSELSGKILEWAADSAGVKSGTLVRVVTTKGITEFH
ncbi:hypothetical protein BC830DRAFT_1174134 [Chytriomyces sp. MP71]|nr:hypothetical protein BC830DRAFT_1174134 [Chytriomyces sp. MP71]